MLPTKSQAAWVVAKLEKGNPAANPAKPSARRIAQKTSRLWRESADPRLRPVKQATVEKVIDLCRMIHDGRKPLQRLESQSLYSVIEALKTSSGFGQ
jgi:hypothetical protein